MQGWFLSALNCFAGGVFLTFGKCPQSLPPLFHPLPSHPLQTFTCSLLSPHQPVLQTVLLSSEEEQQLQSVFSALA